MKLSDTYALVTGASKGIGAATAVALAKAGATVLITYRSDKVGATKILEECDKHSKGNEIMAVDVADETSVRQLFEHIAKKKQTIDILVNNAGIAFDEDTYDNLEIFNTIYETNLLGLVRVTKYAVPCMKQGKIVNVSSLSGKLHQGTDDSVAYSALKAAVNSYTKTLAKVLAPNITVNAVAPGRTITPIWGDLSQADIERLGKGQLIGRMVEAAEVADAVLFLLKNDAVNGEVLTIDGGR